MSRQRAAEYPRVNTGGAMQWTYALFYLTIFCAGKGKSLGLLLWEGEAGSAAGTVS